MPGGKGQGKNTLRNAPAPGLLPHRHSLGRQRLVEDHDGCEVQRYRARWRGLQLGAPSVCGE